jgi:Secretion system C-terminal sorting domain
MKLLITVLFLTLTLSVLEAQQCNKFGAWLWRIEQVGMTHDQLADKLKSLGINRILLKVADGIPEFVQYDEIIDTSVVNTYHRHGMEVWGWSYNYPGRDAQQAEALYLAAKTGYDGFIIDIEQQFDSKVQEIENLFFAFDQAKKRAVYNGLIDEKFKLYCTTWGNPDKHHYAIDLIDKYVDAFMPQTYVEEWGDGFINNIPYWIDQVNQEYRRLKATKPIYHIVSARTLRMDKEKLNEFLQIGGPETSVWRIPGHSVPQYMWETWQQVGWDYSYCKPNDPTCKSLTEVDFSIYPNPMNDQVYVKISEKIDDDYNMQLIDINGHEIHGQQLSKEKTEFIINTENIESGTYFLHFYNLDGYQNFKLIKP